MAPFQTQLGPGSLDRLSGNLKAFNVSARVLQLTGGLLKRWRDGRIWFSIKTAAVTIDSSLLLSCQKTGLKSTYSAASASSPPLCRGLLGCSIKSGFSSGSRIQGGRVVMKLSALMMIASRGALYSEKLLGPDPDQISFLSRSCHVEGKINK